MQQLPLFDSQPRSSKVPRAVLAARAAFAQLSPDAQVLITTGLYFVGESVDDYVQRSKPRDLAWRERVLGSAVTWCLGEHLAEGTMPAGYAAWLDVVLDEALA